MTKNLDHVFMNRALELAVRAKGRTSPNPVVGAVVVKDGVVVGEGFHPKAGAPHAEIFALREAGDDARGATLYVTLEPCCHYGRTGPCTEAIISAGIERVVVAMVDPNPLVTGKGIDRLMEQGVSVSLGVLEKEAANLNEFFIKHVTTGMPFVTLKSAMSLDGKIATRTGESQWITSEEARLHAHRLRDCNDAIMVGINTVLADDPSLTTRLPEPEKGKDAVRVVLDAYARTPLDSKIVRNGSDAPLIIAVSEDAPSHRVERLEAAGAEVLIVPGFGPKVNLDVLIRKLGRREITSVLVEGGGEVHASMLACGLVDKVVWYIAPVLIGGKASPGPVGGEGVARLVDKVELGRLEVSRVGPDICVQGYVKR